MKGICLLILLFLSQQVFALEAKDVIAKMQKVYNKEAHLEYDCTYELFKGHKSIAVETSYKGFVYRNKTNIYQKIDQTEFVYAPDFFMQINHEEEAVVLGLAQRSVNLDVDMNTALKECSKLEIEIKDGYYSITMVIKNNSSLPFSVVKMRIDKTKYFLEQLDLYYSSAQDFSEDSNTKDEAQPHLRISFKEPKFNPKAKNSIFTLATYFNIENKRLIPTGTVAGYLLIDNRIN